MSLCILGTVVKTTDSDWYPRNPTKCLSFLRIKHHLTPVLWLSSRRKERNVSSEANNSLCDKCDLNNDPCSEQIDWLILI